MVKMNYGSNGCEFVFCCDMHACSQHVIVVVHLREDAERLVAKIFGWDVDERFPRRTRHYCTLHRVVTP
jgi:hypothetical protein